MGTQTQSTDDRFAAIMSLPGVAPMTPLEMNEVHFSRMKTVLTPDILKKMDSAPAKVES